MNEVGAPGRNLALRCARALGVSSLAWAVASSAHVLAGGTTPGFPETVCLVAFTAWPLIALLGGVPSRARMVLALLGAQAATHALLELSATPGSAAGSVLLTGGHSGHTSPGEHRVSSVTGSLTHASGGHGMDLVPDPPMIGAHLVAALLLGMALVHGETLLRSTLELLAAVLLPIRVLARTVLVALRVSAASGYEPERLRPARVASARPGRHVLDVVARRVVRRGPPVLA